MTNLNPPAAEINADPADLADVITLDHTFAERDWWAGESRLVGPDGLPARDWEDGEAEAFIARLEAEFAV